MQLDADEDDDAPFFKPAVVHTEPLIPKGRDVQPTAAKGEQAEERPRTEAGDASHEAAVAAATTTVEEEE